MNGAFPPSSIEVRRTFWAASAIRRLPTGVEPVKETFRSRESFSSGPEIPEAEEEATTFRTPAGRPASSMVCAKYCAVSGVSLAGLRTMVQPAATAGATLRVAMASGKFQGVMSRHGPDGFVLDQDLVLALGGGEVAAVVADGFLGEPAQELGPVGDFAAGFGQGLAHFQGHQQREVLGAFGDQVKGPAQDLGPHPGCGPRPGRLDGVGRIEGGDGVLAGGRGEGGEHLPGGGVVHVERAAVGRLPPLPADQQAGGNGGEQGSFTFG